jgi:hypothetical protein
MSKKDFEPEVCDCCDQRTEYLLTLSKGIATIVKAVGAAIREKGENVIHPAKEMQIPADEWTYEKAYQHGKITSSHRGNLSNAGTHQLIEKYEGEAGNWRLTSDGADFLRGEPVPKHAVVAKSTTEAGSHLKRYWKGQTIQTTVHELTGDEMPRWEAVNFDIVEGQIVEKPNYSQGPTRAGKEAGDGKTTNMF